VRPSLLLAAALALATPGGADADANPAELPILEGVGGDFAAPSSLGREVRLADYRGKVVLLFFGYTSCQDVCPVTLAHLKGLVRRLGPEADRVQVLFVTVDPETDTAEHLARYLAQFDARFVGLTGTREQVERVAALFMAEHHRTHDVPLSTKYHRSKPFTDQAYLYTHSQQIYLLDRAGRTRGLYFSGSPLPEMERAVRALLAEGAEGAPDGRGSACDPDEGGCAADPHREHQGRGIEGDGK
jgi:protein SCO1/2